MRLRSTEQDELRNTPRTGGASAESETSGYRAALLPEHAALVEQLQMESGRSFLECARELGYLLGVSIAGDLSEDNDKTVHALFGVVDPSVVIMSEPNDPLANSARELRSAFAAMRKRDGNPVRRLVLLSLETAVEAAVLAANLAVACSLSGQRTLLIDADFSQPLQHDLFRISGEKGLHQLLSAGIDARILVQPTAIAKLDLLPNGAAEAGTGELLERGKLAIATEQACERYGSVIVNGGAADQLGLSCARGFDGVLIAVRRNVTSLTDVRAVIDRLRSAEESTVGLILVD